MGPTVGVPLIPPGSPDKETIPDALMPSLSSSPSITSLSQRRITTMRPLQEVLPHGVRHAADALEAEPRVRLDVRAVLARARSVRAHMRRDQGQLALRSKRTGTILVNATSVGGSGDEKVRGAIVVDI